MWTQSSQWKCMDKLQQKESGTPTHNILRNNSKGLRLYTYWLAEIIIKLYLEKNSDKSWPCVELWFLGYNTKMTSKGENLNKLDFVQMKSFCASMDIIKREKR